MYRFMGYILIPAVISCMRLVAKKEDEKEKSKVKDCFIVRFPKVVSVIACIGVAFFTGCIGVMFLSAEITTFTFWGFMFFVLLSGIVFYVALAWRIKVFENENFFILRDYFGKEYRIYYSDCIEYYWRRQEILVRNCVKDFTISNSLINYERFVRKLNQYHIKKGKPQK